MSEARAKFSASVDQFSSGRGTFIEGLASLNVKELSALNRKLLGDVVERQRKRREQCEDVPAKRSARDIVCDLAHATPYLLALSVAQELIGRLIHEPISWQRVERLIAALPDADRGKLMRSIERTRGWAVRPATVERRVRDASRRGPKKSDERLNLLAFAKALYKFTPRSWPVILGHVNRLAREKNIKRPYGRLKRDEDKDLFSTVRHLQSAICHAQRLPAFLDYFRLYEQDFTTPDPASEQ